MSDDIQEVENVEQVRVVTREGRSYTADFEDFNMKAGMIYLKDVIPSEDFDQVNYMFPTENISRIEEATNITERDLTEGRAKDYATVTEEEDLRNLISVEVDEDILMAAMEVDDREWALDIYQERLEELEEEDG